MDKSNIDNQHDYNDIPVLYCKHCLSLRIMDISDMEDSDYCDNCGSTDIGKCTIEEWENLYKTRYGHLYIE